MVISSMISQGDSFGLSRAYYVKDLGCHNMFYLAYGYELRPDELKCLNIMDIFIHLCDK